MKDQMSLRSINRLNRLIYLALIKDYATNTDNQNILELYAKMQNSLKVLKEELLEA